MKELRELCQSVADELKQIYNGDDNRDLWEYCCGEFLDIEYILNSQKQLIGVRGWVTLGGPSIHADTRNCVVRGVWGVDQAEAWLPSEICEEINGLFEELFY